jgi:membrane-bound lytic murein transglycosylase B
MRCKSRVARPKRPRANGWRAGAGYQPGEPNFAAIEAWNAARVYQKAIALMGRQIDGGQ